MNTTPSTTCQEVKDDYLSPWDREKGHAPSTLTCKLPAGHPGYHRAVEDNMPFGPWMGEAEAQA